MSNDRILSLLGLALRGGRLAVGEEPVEAVARARDARLLLLASDAADNTRRRVEHFADAGQCLWIRIPYTKEQLGRAVGRSSAAILAVTDIGLAAAVGHRLAELDSGRYAESARRLDLKAQRAAQRRAEQLAHEKNVRQGKRKEKKTAVPADAPSAPAQAAPKQGATRPAGPKTAPKQAAARPAGKASRRGQRPFKEERPRARHDRFAGSRPVKKGKGSFRRKES